MTTAGATPAKHRFGFDLTTAFHSPDPARTPRRRRGFGNLLAPFVDAFAARQSLSVEAAELHLSHSLGQVLDALADQPGAPSPQDLRARGVPSEWKWLGWKHQEPPEFRYFRAQQLFELQKPLPRSTRVSGCPPKPATTSWTCSTAPSVDLHEEYRTSTWPRGRGQGSKRVKIGRVGTALGTVLVVLLFVVPGYLFRAATSGQGPPRDAGNL
jgi:hypothetical protein